MSSKKTVQMLNLINYSLKRNKSTSIVPKTQFNINILKSLKKNNLIHAYSPLSDRHLEIRIHSGIIEHNVIQYLKVWSKPSQRKFITVPELKKLRQQKKNNLSLFFISTSEGILDDHEALTKNIGGLLLLQIYI